MKVLVLSPPLAGAGGIQRYTACLVRALQDLLGQQNVRCVAIPELRNGNAGGRFSAGLKLCFGWQALEESARWKPHLIICTHLALGPMGRLLAGLGRRPYWIFVYGIEAWCVLSYWKSSALLHADRVVTISEFSAINVSKRHGIAPEQILRLPCAVNHTLSSIEAVPSGTCARISEGQRLVITVGRLAACERYKGHDVVLRALPSVLARIPNLTYAIVGDGDDRHRLERLAAELGVAKHVVFTGEVTDPELVSLYRRSEIFLMPAKTIIDNYNPKGEGFGIVFLEAMVFGKPVIGPNYGAPAEFIRDGENGLLVDPEDPASVAEALLSLLASPDRAREMGKVASELVRRTYSYDSFRERLRELLTARTPTRMGVNP